MLVQALQPSIPPSEYVTFLASNAGELTSHHTLAICDIQDEDVLEWVSHSEPTRMINISVFTEGTTTCFQHGNTCLVDTCLVDTVVQGLQAVVPAQEAIGFFDGVRLQPDFTLAACTPLSNIVLHWVNYLMNGCAGIDANSSSGEGGPQKRRNRGCSQKTFVSRITAVTQHHLWLEGLLFISQHT